MIVIGIHNTGVLSSAALVLDGRLSFAVAEERLSRVKFDKHFPQRAIAACLAHENLTLDDVDVFAIGWNPAINVGYRYRAGFSEWPAYPGERFYANPNQILPHLAGHDFTHTEQIFHRASGSKCLIDYVNHHTAHIANAYWLSGLNEAAVLSVDGYGERESCVWAHGKGGHLRVLKSQEFPHSLGAFYSAITAHLGFRPDHDEYKVMGAAAYGDPTRYRDVMRALVQLGPEGAFTLDLKYFDHFNFDTPDWFSAAGKDLLGVAPRTTGIALEQIHYDLAAAAQVRLEEALRHALSWLKAATHESALCLTGGVAMNSLCAGRLSMDGPFERVFVPFAPDDSGNSIGAALWAARERGERLELGQPATPFLGPAFSDAQIEKCLRDYRLPFCPLDKPDEAVAERIAQGEIVGVFRGAMEFGQRALGARSILADARARNVKDRMNAAVKYREGFRPFAPAVLREHTHEWFKVPAGGADRCFVPYMEKVFEFLPSCRDRVPAVVHNDGTGRLQTLDAVLHPSLTPIVRAFHAKTGVPMVLNTSFNLNGEPIVCSPTDAIRTFMSSGMDALLLGRSLLTKAP